MQTFDTSCYWDKKITSFIDKTMITYNQIQILLLEPILDPLHQAPSAPPHIFLLSHFFLGNGMGCYGGKTKK
jgi:hypothetical protein